MVRAEKGGYWAMSPGFNTPRPQTRRFVSISASSVTTGTRKSHPVTMSPGSDPVFAGELPQGIDCQRCHGPGGRHADLARTAGAKPGDIRASILNPARLAPSLRMDVCLQCHLQPASEKFLPLSGASTGDRFHLRPVNPLPAFCSHSTTRPAPDTTTSLRL